MLTVVNLDPYWAQDGTLYLDLGALGLPSDRSFAVVDELSGQRYHWFGDASYIRLDPSRQVAHILDLGEAITW